MEGILRIVGCLYFGIFKTKIRWLAVCTDITIQRKCYRIILEKETTKCKQEAFRKFGWFFFQLSLEGRKFKLVAEIMLLIHQNYKK